MPMMAFLNPVYTLMVPFLCLFTIPLAIFAGITTTLAFTVLMFRVFVVYVDIAIAMVPQYVMGRSGSSPRVLPAPYQYTHSRASSRDGSKSPLSPVRSFVMSGQNTPSPTTVYSNPSGSGLPASASAAIPPSLPAYSTGYRSPRRSSGSISAMAGAGSTGFAMSSGRRSRRSSQVSMVSTVGTITPIREGDDDDATPVLATSSSGLMPSVGIDRDYEGVGGWRLDDRNDDENWTNINSRLELPLERAGARHHQRTTSGGPVTPGDGGFLMMKSTRKEGSMDEKEWERNYMAWGRPTISPNSSRLRMNQAANVPSALTSLDKEDGYFPPVVSPKMTKKAAV